MTTHRKLELNRGRREAFKQFLNDRNIDHTEKKKLLKSIFQVQCSPETLVEIDSKIEELLKISHIIRVNNQMISFTQRLAEDLNLNFTIHELGPMTTQVKITGNVQHVRIFNDIVN